MNSTSESDSTPPVPVLGYAIEPVNPAPVQENSALAKTAMGFALASALFSALGLVGVIIAVVQRLQGAHRTGQNAYFVIGLSMFLCPLCLLVGLVFGIVTRRTRIGKSAIFVSLTPIGIVILAIVAIFVFGFIRGLGRS